MARVALVSRNALLAMGLTAAGHDVVEVRLADADRWLAGDGVSDVSAIALDLGDPRTSYRVVSDLRAAGHWHPVLLVASHDPGWADPSLQDLPGVDVLVLPISGPRLADAAARLLARKVVRPIHRVPVPALDPSVLPPPPEATPVIEELITASGAPPPEPSALIGDHQPLPELPGTPLPHPGAADQAVRDLDARLPELSGVPETAAVIAEEAARRIAADGVAVLVPDGDQWRVSGGVGLRALELHLELPEASWYVSQVALADRGLIIQDTDIARRGLIGVPMAAKEHLMAAPVPPVGVVVLLGRDRDPGFDEADLAELGRLAAEAAPLLEAALATRRLARSLHAYEDLPD